jgi:uncharacterized membrane protein required for colicin V production
LPNVLDIIALILVALGTFQGFRRGLSGELAGLVSVVIAFLIGITFYVPFGVWFAEHTRLDEESARVVAFVVTVLVAGALLVLLRLVLSLVMKVVVEKKVDKVGGCIAGFVRSLVLVLTVFLIMNLCPHEYLNMHFGEKSLVGRLVVKCTPVLREKVEGLKGEG